MKKRRPTIAEQLAEFGVDAEDVPPVFRERTLANLKRQQAEELERFEFERDQHANRMLARIQRANPLLGGMLQALMEI